MPLLLPAEPAFPEDGGAERVAWQALVDQLPDDAVLFSGLGLLEGSRECEIDLLVAWPGVGLAAIEVKGGHITRQGGAWLQGSGDARHRIDPFAQVQGARHSLTALLLRRGSAAGRARAAHLVAFPHTFVPATWEISEAPRDLIVDRGGLAEFAFRVKRAIEEHGSGHAPLEPDDVEQLVDVLAGGLPGQIEVLARAAEQEDRIDQMTRDQARLLDHLGHFRRLKVVGGAGSGKTWMALEQARRLARGGERVALLCYSRGLGRYLERVTQQWPPRERPAFVGLFHELPIAWGAERGSDNDSDYWESGLPVLLGELATDRPASELFDSVVVDEGQDFGDLWWPSLVLCLRDPIHGGLFVFMDEAQRVFSRHGIAPIDLPPVTLDENLRSTKQIAQVFGAFADDPVRPRGATGGPVRLVDASFDEVVALADDAVEALLDEGWQPGQIALLATGHRHPAQTNAVDHGGYAAYWDDFFAGTDVFYGHVLGFKGLERTVVVLAVNGFNDLERARTMLYTGMSRARLLLVVIGPREHIERAGGEAVRRRLAAAAVASRPPRER